MCGGVFQSWGAEQLKALDPVVFKRVGGRVSRMEEDLRVQVGEVADGFEGEEQGLTRNWIGNQWSRCRTAVT